MNDARYTIEFVDEADTERLGRALASALGEGGVVALNGPLGAGKTRLVQAVAAELGVDRRDVVSPTFVLVHEYRTGRRPIIHIDAYRINDDDEFLQLGAEEYYRPPNVVLIEWASRVERCLPAERLEITLSVSGDTSRRVDLKALGAAYRAIADSVEQTFRAGGRDLHSGL